MKATLKYTALSFLMRAFTIALRVFNGLVRNRVQPESVLVLPPYSPGSFGDEAVLTSVVNQLVKKGMKKVDLILYKASDDWGLAGVSGTFNMEDFFDFGAWRIQFRFALVVSRYQNFYVLGTDMMDGYYGASLSLQRIRLAELAAMAGTPTRIVGFSFNANPDPLCVQALKNLPGEVQMFGRDPVSHERLTQFLQRPIQASADVAFLLNPEYETDLVREVVQWARKEKGDQRLVIGISANYVLLERIKGLTYEQLVQAYANTLVELYKTYERISFLFIPHDIRGEINDADIAKGIIDAVPAEISAHCFIVPTPCRPGEVKGFVPELDIVLSGRMHLAIACLGQGIPVACMVYQDKFEGLFRLFELKGLTIDPPDAMKPGYLYAFLNPLIDQRVALGESIRAKVPVLQQLSLQNFE
jgi:polysaccharide pyruvyl transferase WcaK-like protein